MGGILGKDYLLKQLFREDTQEGVNRGGWIEARIATKGQDSY